MLKAIVKSTLVAIASCVSLQAVALSQTTPNIDLFNPDNGSNVNETKPETETTNQSAQTNQTNQQAQNELSQEWYSVYEVSDRLIRANKESQEGWSIKLVSQYNPYGYAQNSTGINLDPNIINKFASDSSALACFIGHEMGHQIEKHKMLSEREQGEQERDIEYKAEQEVQQRFQQQSQNERRNSQVTNTIGGLLGGDAKKIIEGIGETTRSPSGVPDRDEMYREILAQKTQELETGWNDFYRQQELEADKIAYTYTVKAGFDPEGCARMMEGIGRLTRFDMRNQELIDSNQTTIDSSERVSNLRKLIAENSPQTLAQQGKTQLSSSQPLAYFLGGDENMLQVGKKTNIANNADIIAQNPQSYEGRYYPDPNDPNAPIPNETYTALQGVVTQGETRSLILFSDRPFSEPGAQPKKEFDANSPIYARIILDRPLRKSLNNIYKHNDGGGYRLLEFVFEGLHEDRWHQIDSVSLTLYVPLEQIEQKYLDIDILPQGNKTTSEYLDSREKRSTAHGFLLGLNNINLEEWHDKNSDYQPMNTYKVELNLYSGLNDYFILHMTPQQHQALITRTEQEVANIGEQQKSTARLPDGFNTPLVPFKDPELSIDNIRRMLDANYNTILKIAIGPGTQDYDIGTDRYGDVNAKMTFRDIWLAYKNEQGECFYKSVTFLRDYIGGGQFGELREVWSTGGDSVPIACENIN